MESTHLQSLGTDLLDQARASRAGRSATALHPGRHHHLRQTVIALAADHRLDEHEAPAEATLQVLTGSVRLTAGEESWEGSTGDLLVIPDHRHDLLALEDAVVLLTTLVDPT
ncbi:cupin domain-containing protein [Aeromicrobium duanguangcaii]|uniref:cupin domain-containing protein n=1 Tax=Aeromicrobium duanguangcaii TaxID=2968086 RepID=UPI002016C07B|nr:cupin domain-containing protein [Aeromicrobium duanguangcaii]MCL3838548.1 cupin domain-containing protein [Aeromicrobium duanguangcaii]